MTGRGAAFFDVDGTLKKGLAIVEFPTYLSERGYFDSPIEREIHDLAEQNEQGKVSYRFISTRIPYLYAAGIKGQRRLKILELAVAFVREGRKSFLPYSGKLVSLMSGNGLLNIAMSGSPVETVLPLKGMGFAKVYGSEMATLNGKYIGEVKTNLCIAEEKSRLLEELIKEHGIDLGRSFAFGDTEQDLPVLEAVGNPIVLNPNLNLKRYATRRGWLIPRNVLKEVRTLL